jgi:hypothetical protein
MAPQHWCQEVECGQEAWTHQSIGRWHLVFHLVMGALRPPVVTLAEGRSQLGVGLSPSCPPLSILSRSAPLFHHGSKFRIQALVRWGPLWEQHEAMVSLTFFSPISKVPDIQTWLAVLICSMTFPFSHSQFLWISGTDLLEIYLWGEPFSPVTLSPPWYAFW